jgi:cupin fold WbuC family metalloprotein
MVKFMVSKYRFLNPEVLYPADTIVMTEKADIDHFKQLSSANSRKRVRLCAHDHPDNCLHEMLIVHERCAYVRPHKHPSKSESMHIIEGLVDVVIFDDGGQIREIIRMGDYASGMIFYYRMAVPAFHTLIIRSDILVFHETTNGPFVLGDTVFASWAPDEKDMGSVRNFMADLNESVGRIR